VDQPRRREAKTHGRRIRDTIEHTNDFGIANRQQELLPENTVCLSRTASVGYVVVMGQPMATSQDFVNWVLLGPDLIRDFLKYFFLAEGRGLLRSQVVQFTRPSTFQRQRLFTFATRISLNSGGLSRSSTKPINGIAAAKVALKRT